MWREERKQEKIQREEMTMVSFCKGRVGGEVVEVQQFTSFVVRLSEVSIWAVISSVRRADSDLIATFRT